MNHSQTHDAITLPDPTRDFLSRLCHLTHPAITQTIRIQLPDMLLELRTNARTLAEQLSDYFDCVITRDMTQTADLTLVAFEIAQPEERHHFEQLKQRFPWQNWQREAGKTGRKEACYDSQIDHHNCRWILKVKTDMIFCQLSPQAMQAKIASGVSFAFGPTLKNPNQIINFMLTQYLNEQQRRGSLLGHASALMVNGKGLAIAGLSGGGKSTLMLKLLEQGEHFVSNDRVLFHRNPTTGIEMRGIPKQPRINPGTIVFNPRLQGLMSDAERQHYLAMPSEELRAHEEKYDADVNRLYWPNCYLADARLKTMVILNWEAQTDKPTQLNQTTFHQRPDLIAAVLKTPGVFFAPAQSTHFLANGEAPNPEAYQSLLGDIPCFELTGKIDFEVAAQLVLASLAQIA